MDHTDLSDLVRVICCLDKKKAKNKKAKQAAPGNLANLWTTSKRNSGYYKSSSELFWPQGTLDLILFYKGETFSNMRLKTEMSKANERKY